MPPTEPGRGVGDKGGANELNKRIAVVLQLFVRGCSSNSSNSSNHRWGTTTNTTTICDAASKHEKRVTSQPAKRETWKMPTKMRQPGAGRGRVGGVSEWQLHLAVQPLKGGAQCWRGRGRGRGVACACLLHFTLH